jgi:hypothetical protein
MNTFRSERLNADLHLGKLPAGPLRAGTVKYADLRPALVKAGALPPLPKMWGHGHDFPQGEWLMLGNGPLANGEGQLPAAWAAAQKGCGDCTIAGPAHEEMEAAKNAGRPVPRFSAQTVIDQYIERTKAANGTGYDPETGSGDTGLEIQAVNEWREQEGIADDAGNRYKIFKPIALEPGNIHEQWEANWLFEKVGLGLVLTEAQMTQFDERAQPTWDYVAGSPEIGGHYVPEVGKLGLISWAEDVYYTPRFIEHQNDEAYAYIDPEIFNRITGKADDEFDEADLERFVVELGKQKIAQQVAG